MAWHPSRQWIGNRGPQWPFEIDRSNPLANGLVGFWKMNGPPGSKIRNLATPGTNDGTIVNASGDVTTIKARETNGEVVYFTGDATADRVDLGSAPSSSPLSLSGTTIGSLMFYGYYDVGADEARIFDKSTAGSAANGWNFAKVSAATTVRFGANASGGAASATNFLTVGEITGGFTYKTSPVIFYKNGKLFSQTTITRTFPTTTANAAIGNWNHTTARMWGGWIDWVGIWNRALSAEEAWLLYAPQTRWDLLRSPYPYVITTAAAAASLLYEPLSSNMKSVLVR